MRNLVAFGSPFILGGYSIRSTEVLHLVPSPWFCVGFHDWPPSVHRASIPAFRRTGMLYLHRQLRFFFLVFLFFLAI